MLNIKFMGAALVLSLSLPLPIHGDGGWTSARPDGHAPLSVMGDHVHHQGELMTSYRFMTMDMEGNRRGTDSRGTGEVLAQFPVAPTQMTMTMHMLGAMYALSDSVTLTAMFPFLDMAMDHVTRMGQNFTTETSGLGDIQLGALIPWWKRDGQTLHFNLGLSLPTGSVDERGSTPAGPDQALPYPMQLGSGTVDLKPGLTYLGMTESWSWGLQPWSTVRLGRNKNKYRLGNRLSVNAWGARRWTPWLSTSVKTEWSAWGTIKGADPQLNPRLVPTADPGRRGGQRADLGIGFNLYAPTGSPLQGHRLGVEWEIPFYQHLDGPQLESDWQLTAGWQWTFAPSH